MKSKVYNKAEEYNIKKIILTFIAGIFLISCNSENKMVKNGENFLKANVLDPKTYENIESKVIDTCYISDSMYHKIDIRISLFKAIEESRSGLISKGFYNNISGYREKIYLIIHNDTTIRPSIKPYEEQRTSKREIQFLLYKIAQINFADSLLHDGDVVRRKPIIDEYNEDLLIFNKILSDIESKKVVYYRIMYRYYAVNRLGLRGIHDTYIRYYKEQNIYNIESNESLN